MTFQDSVEVRNAKLDAACKCIGSGAVLRLYSGEQPHSCEDDPEGALLAEIKLPAPCMSPAENGEQEMNGEWAGEASGDGEASCFRICSSDGLCCQQGSVSDHDGDGDIKLNNTDLKPGQNVTIESFTIVGANV